MGSLGGPELLIVFLIVLLLFGGSQLPKLARSIGQAQREFRDGMHEGLQEDQEGDDDPSDA